VRPPFGSRFAFAALLLPALALTACPPGSSGGECGLAYEVSLNAVLTTTSPLFYLSTPDASDQGTPTCQTEYELTWRWADTTRANTDTSMPQLLSMDKLFRVIDDNHWYTYTETPQRSTTTPYEWTLTHSDHGTGDPARTTAPFFIRTAVLSTAARDSVLISAVIHYH
jgi:hypothetical protein